MARAAQDLQLVLAADLALGREPFANQPPEERVAVAHTITMRFPVAMQMVELETLG